MMQWFTTSRLATIGTPPNPPPPTTTDHHRPPPRTVNASTNPAAAFQQGIGYSTEVGQSNHAGLAATILALPAGPQAAAVAATVRMLHPATLTEAVPPSLSPSLEAIRASHADTVAALLKDHARYMASTGAGNAAAAPSSDDALLLLLKLEMNAFASGIYSALSLVNHSPEPNCIKFNPQPG